MKNKKTKKKPKNSQTEKKVPNETPKTQIQVEKVPLEQVDFAKHLERDFDMDYSIAYEIASFLEPCFFQFHLHGIWEKTDWFRPGKLFVSEIWDNSGWSSWSTCYHRNVKMERLQNWIQKPIHSGYPQAEKQTLVQNLSMAYFTAKTKLSGHSRAKGNSSNSSGALKFAEESEVRIFRVSGDDLTLENKPVIQYVPYDTYLEILVDVTNKLVHLHYCVVAYGS